MSDLKLTAGEQRLLDATIHISRLALYLGLEPYDLRAALGVCSLTLVKDDKHVIAEHEALFPDWQAT